LRTLPWKPAAPDRIELDTGADAGTALIPRGMSARLLESALEPAARERSMLELAASAGAALLEGRACGLIVQAASAEEALRGIELAFALLQTTRLRMSRADFISCPSCGRTHFELQETARRVRERFGHLAGVKIAVMGCIVNGPGEMADADFGYVGSAPGRVDLYCGSERVERGLPSEEAADRLQALLAEHGLWRAPRPAGETGGGGSGGATNLKR
jgi:(E)-4-hydroxy-3-methylbut-2-enyl-diphosphate synthase